VKDSFEGIYEGRTVLLTGHTGFKGAWLAIWLRELGAKVIGYSLEASTNPSIFSLTNLAEDITHILGDVRDFKNLKRIIDLHQPEIIFHLAAQPLVLASFDDPRGTFETNTMGTVNLMEAVRFCSSVKAVVIITTDKVYENKEWLWGYRENDPLGGSDPYSASKGMAELAVFSYKKSFFNPTINPEAPSIATVRAGNVIGGGDFSDFRIVPDCMKALMNNQTINVRNGSSVRPWLNVLDPLSGYLWLGAMMVSKMHAFSESWNFGPMENQAITVKELVEKVIELWGRGEWIDNSSSSNGKSEMGLLRLNWDKAANYLKWHPVYSWQEAIQQTVDWFREFQALSTKYSDQFYMDVVCVKHIQAYTEKAREKKVKWLPSEMTQEISYAVMK
jgi:CDP-glucose 4,6-dehydratase